MNNGAAALVDYLRDRAVECPLCGYGLRDLQSDVCPECGHELVLRIGEAHPRLMALLLVIFPGAAALVGAVMMTVLSLLEGFPSQGDFWMYFIFMWCSGLISLLLMVKNKWFRKRTPWAQRGMIAGVWGPSIFFFVAFTFRGG
jgi:hypothetical protein